MPKIVISHDVVDVDKWLQGKSVRVDAIGGMGCTNVVDHVPVDGSKTIAITCDADDVDLVVKTVADPPAEMLAAMQEHGVVPPIAIYVER